MSIRTDTGAAVAPPPAIDWREAARRSCLEVDWTKVAHTALGSALLAGLVGGALHVLGKAIEAQKLAEAEVATRTATTDTTPEGWATTDQDAIEVNDADDADANDVDDDADADDADDDGADDDDADGPSTLPIVDEKAAAAAALLGVEPTATEDEIRAALRSLLSSSRLHPDHGGDGEAAKRLIAAKNLLIERARAVRS